MANKRHIKEAKYNDTVICISSCSPSLTVGKEYTVIDVYDSIFKIVNNNGKGTFYSKSTTKFILKDIKHTFEIRYMVCEYLYGTNDSIQYSDLFDTKTQCLQYIEDAEQFKDECAGYRVFDIKEVFVK